MAVEERLDLVEFLWLDNVGCGTGLERALLIDIPIESAVDGDRSFRVEAADLFAEFYTRCVR